MVVYHYVSQLRRTSIIDGVGDFYSRLGEFYPRVYRIDDEDDEDGDPRKVLFFPTLGNHGFGNAKSNAHQLVSLIYQYRGGPAMTTVMPRHFLPMGKTECLVDDKSRAFESWIGYHQGWKDHVVNTTAGCDDVLIEGSCLCCHCTDALPMTMNNDTFTPVPDRSIGVFSVLGSLSNKLLSDTYVMMVKVGVFLVCDQICKKTGRFVGKSVDCELSPRFRLLSSDEKERFVDDGDIDLEVEEVNSVLSMDSDSDGSEYIDPGMFVDLTTNFVDLTCVEDDDPEEDMSLCSGFDPEPKNMPRVLRHEFCRDFNVMYAQGPAIEAYLAAAEFISMDASPPVASPQNPLWQEPDRYGNLRSNENVFLTDSEYESESDDEDEDDDRDHFFEYAQALGED